jgi:hypothetical protein
VSDRLTIEARQRARRIARLRLNKPDYNAQDSTRRRHFPLHII